MVILLGYWIRLVVYFGWYFVVLILSMGDLLFRWVGHDMLRYDFWFAGFMGVWR